MQEKTYLGVMLDASRNAVMSVEGLKRFIDTIQKMGYNCLQLYTEDTYEIDGEPLFGYLRGRYTKAELKEIDTYAKEHGVEMMPCIQTLAHLNQIFQFPKYDEVKDLADILLVGEEKTYQLIEKMFQTFSECFSSRHIHIGMDEAHFLGLGKYLDRNGYQNRFDVLLGHLKRVCDIAEKYGYQPMMWSDMFFRLAFHGDYYKKNGVIPEEVKQKVPKNIELVYWDYYNTDKELCESMMDNHLSFNRKVWFFGGAWKWCGFNSGNQFSFDTTKPTLEVCQEKGVKNVLITMWGDNGNESPAYCVLPALMYAAECYRGNFDLAKTKEKFESLFGESWDDFMLLDFPMPKEVKRMCEVASGAKEMLYNDYFVGKFDYMVSEEGYEGKRYKELSEKLSEAAMRSKNYGYIFHSYAKLCNVLSVKYDLGYRTRKAYQAGDKGALKSLVNDYQTVLAGLDEFLKEFRKMWFYDNKPHGFDVQDIRIGGVIARTNSCMARLKAYIDGETDKIEELEETIVDYYTGGEPSREMTDKNLYSILATVNIL
ncbi:MAG: beta-N-acetylhexosaminidase [Clostridia bacterium]|nr:beta-N-acetylhexosaminidase [Clostridia bacterium]